MRRQNLEIDSGFGLFAARPDRPMPGGSGTAVMVGRVVSPASEIAAGRFLLVNPVQILGPEVEGGPGTVGVVDTATVPVYLVGPEVARPGDLLLCRFVDHRWAAERGGSSTTGGYQLGGCPCTAIPATIFMHLADPPTGGGDQFVFPAALRYQAKPADLSGYTADPTGYYTDAVFTSNSGNYVFRYWFGCTQGQYFVSGLLVPGSPVGYPGRFLVQTWLAGLPGNTCTPFSLTNGTTQNTAFRAMGISVNGTGPA